MRLPSLVLLLAGALLAGGCSATADSSIYAAPVDSAACSVADTYAAQFTRASDTYTSLVAGGQWVRCSGMLSGIPTDAVGVEFSGKLVYFLVAAPGGGLERGSGPDYTRTLAVQPDASGDAYSFQIVLSDSYGSSSTYTAALEGPASSPSWLRVTDTTGAGDTASFGAHH